MYYAIALRVSADTRPLPGAEVYQRERLLGATDSGGSFRMRTLGQEGATVELNVRCPAGFTSPTAPVAVPLRSVVALGGAQGQSAVETTVQCPPAQRIAAVILRAPNRGNLPVRYQGQEVTRTDPQGVAHMIFRVPANEVLTFQLDTTAQPLLRPQNPLLNVTTHATDDVYVVTQNFEVQALTRVRGPRRAPRPRIQQIRSTRGPFGFN